MKPIRNILVKLINWIDRSRRDQPECEPVSINYSSGIAKSSSMASAGGMGHGMNFSVFPAVGGKVVRFQTYDPRTDRETTTLYVVTDKENLGEELGQIITKESLSR